MKMRPQNKKNLYSSTASGYIKLSFAANIIFSSLEVDIIRYKLNLHAKRTCKITRNLTTRDTEHKEVKCLKNWILFYYLIKLLYM